MTAWLAQPAQKVKRRANSQSQPRLLHIFTMSGIAHAAVRLAGPSILKRSSSSLITATSCCSGASSSSSSSWRRPSSISSPHSTAAFSTSSSPTNNNNDPPSTETTTSSSNNNKNNHRLKTLSLYRQLLRGAERMPTPNRQNYIKRKTRHEFRKHMTLTDENEIDFQLRLADTNLDTVLVQAEHLSRLFSDPEYQNYN
eukprot:scaffold11756_cov151-Skeletonema_menzelii.AAC.11